MPSTSSRHLLPDPHVFSHEHSPHPLRRQQQQLHGEKSVASKSRRGRKGSAVATERTRSASFETRRAARAGNGKKAAEAEDQREEIQIDQPPCDGDDICTEWFENVEVGCYDSSPTLMELGVWDAEHVRRSAEAARDMAFIRGAISALRADAGAGVPATRSSVPVELTAGACSEIEVKRGVIIPAAAATQARGERNIVIDSASNSEAEDGGSFVPVVAKQEGYTVVTASTAKPTVEKIIESRGKKLIDARDL
ncbi:hypothetical protein DQ04_03981020 [Trypanosoma grayi]|uniref:hypothetical protein n=1 Tax=Trypanosoma grayi TaxID=71804 RepID=UPI0004F448E8|nr:hypothetical protein DQ04_03981020 [Trypanosoma grayi]KEG10249.1 hypothetical protein DQ04_03981020 [Trypanosoma grayi]